MVTVTTTPPLEGTALQSLVVDIRALAIRALKRMYRPDQRVFAFCLRRTPAGDVLEGISNRYTAITLIGLHDEPAETAGEILGEANPADLCGRLIEEAQRAEDIGEVALTLWAAWLMSHPRAGAALDRLRAMDPVQCSCPTVELAWCLTSLTVPGSDVGDRGLAERIAGRLLASYHKDTGLFAHYPAGANVSAVRAHVCCYADLVYPIQALSYYHRVTNNADAIAAARRSGQRMRELQGSAGQWWWHYDIRTGHVVEGYPVYAVHQDAMGPMALFALEEAGGDAHHNAIRKSLEWLVHPPEIDGSLLDRPSDVIWRKVARREPNKLTRKLQATASRVHPSLRVPGVDQLFPPCAIDWESRPYHMGWLLHAFSAGRTARLLGA